MPKKKRATDEARPVRASLLRYTRLFADSDDLGDRADRYGPEMVRLIDELAETAATAPGMGTQDKVKARGLRANLMHYTRAFADSDDLGDKACRYGPEMVRLINELATLENWENRP